VVKFAELKDAVKSKQVSLTYRGGRQFSTESVSDKLKYMDIFRERKTVTNSATNVHTIKTRSETRRKSIGKPMIVKFPSLAVLPVTVPGNSSEHIGYLVLQDVDGKPLTFTNTNESSGQNVASVLDKDTKGGITPAQQAFKNLVADTSANINTDQLFTMYKDILERQIYTTISDSLYGKNIEISNKNDIYYTMFMRALAEQRTNIMFVPKELMVYFHFNLNEQGIGKFIDNSYPNIPSGFNAERTELPASYTYAGVERFREEFNNLPGNIQEEVKNSLKNKVQNMFQYYRKKYPQQFDEVIEEGGETYELLNRTIMANVVPISLTNLLEDSFEKTNDIPDDNNKLLMSLKNIINHLTNGEKLSPSSQEIMNKIR
jgi:hypothetical protein